MELTARRKILMMLYLLKALTRDYSVTALRIGVLRHVKIPLMTHLCRMIFEACPTALDAISRVLKRGNLDENQQNSLVTCAHAHTLIEDFCLISRCDRVIKSPFNSRAGRVCRVCPRHTHARGTG